MFKNRAAQVTFVKTPKASAEGTSSPKTPRFTETEIKTFVEIGKGIAVTFIFGAIALKSTDAICQIAVNIAPKN